MINICSDMSIKTDINTYDYGRDNYLHLKETYKLFNYNIIDQYNKLINKNKDTHNDYLEDFVNDFTRYDLQNCNFVETTVPKLYDNKILKTSNGFSNRKLSSRSPLMDFPQFDNNDIQNDYTKEIDIKFDEPKLKNYRMDYTQLSYLSTRGADNTTNGLIEWRNPPDFSETKYKNADKKMLNNNLLTHETDYLNTSEEKRNYKLLPSNKQKNNTLQYNQLSNSDIQYDNDSKTDKAFVNMNSDSNINKPNNIIKLNKDVAYDSEINPYKEGFSNKSKFDELKLNYKMPSKEKHLKHYFNSDEKNHYRELNELYKSSVNHNNNNDKHISDVIKNSLYSIIHNDINDSTLNHYNNKSKEKYHPKNINLHIPNDTNFSNKSFDKFDKHGNHNIYKQILNYTKHNIYYNSDIKELKRDKDYYNEKLIDSNVYNTHKHSMIDNMYKNIMNNKIFYNGLKEDILTNMKDNKYYYQPNYFNKSDTTPNKTMQHMKKNNFEHYDNTIPNKIQELVFSDIRPLKEQFVDLNALNRKNTEYDVPYMESLDLNDTYSMYNKNSRSIYNNQPNKSNTSISMRSEMMNDFNIEF